MTGMQSDDWVQKLTEQIGMGIDRARGKHSDQWIADRTQALHHPISRTAISEYRRGVRKTITVSDWLVISAALGVPPVTLLFPGLPDRPSVLLPIAEDVAAFDALQWVTGARQTLPEGFDVLLPLGDGEEAVHIDGKREYTSSLKYSGGRHDLRFEHDPSPEMQLLTACRELADLYSNLFESDSADWWMSLGSSEERDAKLKAYKKLMEEASKKKEELERKITQLGGEIHEPKVNQNDDENGSR